jgi:hypothetical protein
MTGLTKTSWPRRERRGSGRLPAVETSVACRTPSPLPFVRTLILFFPLLPVLVGGVFAAGMWVAGY